MDESDTSVLSKFLQNQKMQVVLLRISKSCKRTDSNGFLKKSADPDADSDSGLRRPPPAAP